MSWILAVMTVSMLWGCAGEENCQAGVVDSICLSDLGCLNSEHEVKLNSTKEFELIRSQDEYEVLVTDPCDIQIDWQQYDLVIGNVQLDGRLLSIEKSALFSCTQQRLVLNVRMLISAQVSSEQVTWSFVIPKSSDFFVQPLVIE
ncbi:MAG: hypothetical protein AAFQ02_11325 [Bacteroidota bacterium]